MAVKIRLRRVGAKKAPFYRVVVADSRFPRDARLLRRISVISSTPLKSPRHSIQAQSGTNELPRSRRDRLSP